MQSQTTIIIFDFLAVFGFILLGTTLIAASFSPHIHRSKTWASMIVAWMVYAASYMLTFGYQSGPEPPKGLCVLQMQLIYASPTIATLSGFTFIIDVYLRINNALFTSKYDHKYTRALVIAPWTIFAGVAAICLIVVNDFAEVQRNPDHMYCHSVGDTQTRISAFICVIGLSLAFCLEVWMAIVLYRNWALFRKLSSKTSLKDKDLRLSSLIRILVFNLQIAVGIGLGGFVTPKDVTSGGSWEAFLPLLSVFCGLAFGTQGDIVRCWMFWKRSAHSSPSVTPKTSPTIWKEDV